MESRKLTLSVSNTNGYESVKTFGEQRICAHPECTTVLSVYNPGIRCPTHKTARDARFPCSPGQGKSRRRFEELS